MTNVNDGSVRLLPEDTERLLAFGAMIQGRESLATVLRWQEDGLVDGVEISWTEDPPRPGRPDKHRWLMPSHGKAGCRARQTEVRLGGVALTAICRPSPSHTAATHSATESLPG